MKNYEVVISFMAVTVDVKAKDEDEAWKKAESEWNNNVEYPQIEDMEISEIEVEE
jgi:hypothetical protein